jgi:hypothetical protein
MFFSLRRRSPPLKLVREKRAFPAPKIFMGEK